MEKDFETSEKSKRKYIWWLFSCEIIFESNEN